jgi:hypothetical protein
MSNELAVYESSGDIAINRAPEEVLEEAKKVAKALGDVVRNKKKPVIMNGEQYLEFEDWQTVGRFYGVTAKVISTEFIQYGEVQGFEAKAVAVRPDGMEVSAAEAMCMNDEPNWKSKPLFQLRSMAQTRACAKALRNCLAWVVVLAGYRATPAEEIQDMAQQKTDIKPPQSKSAPIPSEPGKSAKESFIAELSNHVKGDVAQFKKLMREFTAFGDNKGIDDVAKLTEKWSGSALGKLRKVVAEKTTKPEDQEQESCTKDPLTCGESMFDEKDKAFCGDNNQIPCKYQTVKETF